MKAIFLYLIFIIISFSYFVKGNINYIKENKLECAEIFQDPTKLKKLNDSKDYASNVEECNNLLTKDQKESDSCCYISVLLKNNTWYNYCGKLSNMDKKEMDNVINKFIGSYKDYISGDGDEKMKKSLKIDCLGERLNFKFIILLISILSFI